MADATYLPKIYRKQGGLELVVASGGTITYEAGATIDGSADGVAIKEPVQTVSSSATTITAYGLTLLTGSTAGPSYLIANPVIGAKKQIILVPGTSAATQRATIQGGTTAVSFSSTGKNLITLATSALRSCSLVGVSTAAYHVTAVFTSTMGGFSNQST